MDLKQDRPREISALTGLRFIAALTVAISHGIQLVVPFSAPPAWYLIFQSLAGIGMSLFFVLSGFVIHYNYAESIRNHGGRSIFNFFVARFSRVYPLFLICLLYDLGWKLTYAQLPASTAQALPYYLTMTQSWFFRNLGTEPLIFQFGPSPTVGWSVSTEWFFYCVYPLICLLLARLRNPLGVGAGMVTLVLLVLLVFGSVGHYANIIDNFGIRLFGPGNPANPSQVSSFFRWIFYFSPYSRIFEFLLGCLCADLIMKLRWRPLSRFEHRFGLTLTSAAVFLIIVSYLLIYPFSWLIPAATDILLALRMCFGIAVPCVLLIFCCARYDNVVVRALSAPRLILCGEASYSLYLLHPMVIDSFRFESAESSISPLILAGNCMRLGLTLLTCVGLSFVTWQIVEMPARRFLRKLLTLPSRPAAPLATAGGMIPVAPAPDQ
jgi:peptidoglycan/LPS O-acetylase OafA/YrhL